MEAEQIKAKLGELKTLLGIGADTPAEELWSAMWDRVNTLIQAEQLADILTGTGGEAAPTEEAAAASALSTWATTARAAVVALGVDLDGLKAALDLLDAGTATPEQVKAVIEGALMQQAAADSGDSAQSTGGETAAGAPPAASDATRTLADDGAGGEPNAADAEAAASAELMSLVSQAAETAGTDVAGVLAALRDRLEEFATWIGQTPDSGTQTNEAAMSRRLSMMAGSIEALTARATAAEAKLSAIKARDDESRATSAKAKAKSDVAALIEDGRLLEAQRAKWEGFALSDREQFDEVVADMPKIVPTGQVALSGNDDAAPDAPAAAKIEVDIGGVPTVVDMTPRNEAETRFLSGCRSPNRIKARTLHGMRQAVAN
jgi:hypothetical protein